MTLLIKMLEDSLPLLIALALALASIIVPISTIAMLKVVPRNGGTA